MLFATFRDRKHPYSVFATLPSRYTLILRTLLFLGSLFSTILWFAQIYIFPNLIFLVLTRSFIFCLEIN